MRIHTVLARVAGGAGHATRWPVVPSNTAIPLVSATMICAPETVIGCASSRDGDSSSPNSCVHNTPGDTPSARRGRDVRRDRPAFDARERFRGRLGVASATTKLEEDARRDQSAHFSHRRTSVIPPRSSVAVHANGLGKGTAGCIRISSSVTQNGVDHAAVAPAGVSVSVPSETA